MLAAREAGLKVMMVTGGKAVHQLPTSQEYSNYLDFLSKRYMKDTVLIAYDLLNEPEYFHKVGDKREVSILVSQWSNIIRRNTKNQLITIGLTSGNTTHDWDPELLDVDFHSFHLYPDTSIDQHVYFNHMQWFSKALKKPWIIGETGFAASDLKTDKFIDGNVEEQVDFYSKTYKRCFDCGGIGYSWWQFHDASWSPDYGILNSNHKAKPVASVLQSLHNYIPNPNDCYKNKLESRISLTKKKKYSAQIVDKNNKPINNAVVNAGLGGGKYEFSYTDENGFFEFNTRKKVRIINITAQGYETRRIKTFFKGDRLVLKKIKLDEDYINDWHTKTKLEYCELMSEREYKDCQKYCGSDSKCIKECKNNFNSQKKICKEKTKPNRI